LTTSGEGADKDIAEENLRWNNIIKGIDKDNNGKISLEEFTEAFETFVCETKKDSAS